MKRDKIEKFIGKRVTIVLIDGDEITGELHKTGEDMFKNDANLYIPKNYYTLINPKCHLIFRSSHVKKIQLNKG